MKAGLGPTIPLIKYYRHCGLVNLVLQLLVPPRLNWNQIRNFSLTKILLEPMYSSEVPSSKVEWKRSAHQPLIPVE